MSHQRDSGSRPQGEDSRSEAECDSTAERPREDGASPKPISCTHENGPIDPPKTNEQIALELWTSMIRNGQTIGGSHIAVKVDDANKLYYALQSSPPAIVGEGLVEAVARDLYKASPSIATLDRPWEAAADNVCDHFLDMARTAIAALQSHPPRPVEQERAMIVAWLRNELTAVPRIGPDRAYRMGQQDALKLAIDAIESGEHSPPLDEGEG